VKIVLTFGRPIQGIKHYINELQLTGKDDYVIDKFIINDVEKPLVCR